jgi:hypothetical protein
MTLPNSTFEEVSAEISRDPAKQSAQIDSIRLIDRVLNGNQGRGVAVLVAAELTGVW